MPTNVEMLVIVMGPGHAQQQGFARGWHGLQGLAVSQGFRASRGSSGLGVREAKHGFRA